MTKKEIMKWIQRLHVKSTHAKMVEGEMSFADYRNYIEYVINLIRGIAGFGEMKKSDFDLALFLFVGFYMIGYFKGKLEELKSERELLDEWEKSDAELFAAWEKDIKDLKEHSNKIIVAWENSSERIFAEWRKDIEDLTGKKEQ